MSLYCSYHFVKVKACYQCTYNLLPRLCFAVIIWLKILWSPIHTVHCKWSAMQLTCHCANTMYQCSGWVAVYLWSSLPAKMMCMALDSSVLRSSIPTRGFCWGLCRAAFPNCFCNQFPAAPAICPAARLEIMKTLRMTIANEVDAHHQHCRQQHRRLTSYAVLVWVGLLAMTLRVVEPNRVITTVTVMMTTPTWHITG